MLAASISFLAMPSASPAQGWRESIGDRQELRELLGDRIRGREDLRGLLSDRLERRAALRDLILDRLEQRQALRDLILNRLKTRNDLRDLLRERLGGEDADLSGGEAYDRGDLRDLGIRVRARIPRVRHQAAHRPDLDAPRHRGSD